MGELLKSILDFDEAVKLDDKNPIIYSNRGLVNRKLERYDKAIEDYTNEIAHTANGDSFKAYNNRAYCLAKLARYADAIQDYSTVI